MTRKPGFLRITGEPVIIGEKRKFSCAPNLVKIQMQETFFRYLVWFSQKRYPLKGLSIKKRPQEFIKLIVCHAYITKTHNELTKLKSA
jgi:hypothetical protein